MCVLFREETAPPTHRNTTTVNQQQQGPAPNSSGLTAESGAVCHTGLPYDLKQYQPLLNSMMVSLMHANPNLMLNPQLVQTMALQHLMIMLSHEKNNPPLLGSPLVGGATNPMAGNTGPAGGGLNSGNPLGSSLFANMMTGQNLFSGLGGSNNTQGSGGSTAPPTTISQDTLPSESAAGARPRTNVSESTTIPPGMNFSAYPNSDGDLKPKTTQADKLSTAGNIDSYDQRNATFPGKKFRNDEDMDYDSGDNAPPKSLFAALKLKNAMRSGSRTASESSSVKESHVKIREDSTQSEMAHKDFEKSQDDNTVESWDHFDYTGKAGKNAFRNV